MPRGGNVVEDPEPGLEIDTHSSAADDTTAPVCRCGTRPQHSLQVAGHIQDETRDWRASLAPSPVEAFPAEVHAHASHTEGWGTRIIGESVERVADWDRETVEVPGSPGALDC